MRLLDKNDPLFKLMIEKSELSSGRLCKDGLTERETVLGLERIVFRAGDRGLRWESVRRTAL